MGQSNNIGCFIASSRDSLKLVHNIDRASESLPSGVAAEDMMAMIDRTCQESARKDDNARMVEKVFLGGSVEKR